MATTGSSQQEVLNQLMEHKAGATLDELVTAVGLSRTAVNQHLMALEREGYVRKGTPRKTGGRPAERLRPDRAGNQPLPQAILLVLPAADPDPARPGGPGAAVASTCTTSA